MTGRQLQWKKTGWPLLDSMGELGLIVLVEKDEDSSLEPIRRKYESMGIYMGRPR